MKKKAVLTTGLDIGNYSIKSVELTCSGDSIQLHRVSILPLADTSTATLHAALKVMLDPAAPPKHLRISVSGPSILIRRISLPLMTPSELKGAIRFEAESHIPFPINDCILDFQILNQEPGKKTMNVLLVAAKKDFIQARLKLLSELGLEPEVIDVDIFCLVNAFEMLGEGQDQKVYGLLNIGHQVSSFAIIQDKLPFFVREIPFGGTGVTRALAEAKGVSELDADRLKTDLSGETPEEINTAVHKGFEPLIEEIRHSIDYFENEVGDELRHIWASGGGALVPGVSNLFSEELGKKVSLWDNTKKMEIFGGIDKDYLAQHSSELDVAFGMVLREVGRKK